MTIDSTFRLQTHSRHLIYLYVLISYLSMSDIMATRKSDTEKVLFLSRDTLYTIVDEWNKGDRVSILN
jgi:hypothetical protein